MYFVPGLGQQGWLAEERAGCTCRGQLVRWSIAAGSEMWVKQRLCLACSYGRASKSHNYDFAFKVVLKDCNYTVCSWFLRINAFCPLSSC